MKKILYTLFLLTLLMGCKDEHTKKYSYSDLKSAVDEQDAQKICLILDSIETLPVEQLNEITYKSLSKYKNYEIPKMFYEYGLDINEVFSYINQSNGASPVLEKTTVLYYVINNNSVDLYEYAESKNVDFTQNCYESVKECVKPLVLAAKNKSLILSHILKDIKTKDLPNVNLDEALYYIKSKDDIIELLSRADIIDYLYTSPKFSEFVCSYYNSDRLNYFEQKIDFSKLTFSSEINYFESALNSENRLDTIKWLINNKFDPNKKMTYDISQDTELTVKEAAWEYAHRIRFSYYDENGVLDEKKMKADPTWLSFQSVIDYLDN